MWPWTSGRSSVMLALGGHSTKEKRYGPGVTHVGGQTNTPTLLSTACPAHHRSPSSRWPKPTLAQEDWGVHRMTRSPGRRPGHTHKRGGREEEREGEKHRWALGSLNRNSQSDDLFWILLHEGWKGLVWGQRTPLPHCTPSSGIFQLVCAAGANPSPRPPAFACAAPLTQAPTSPNTVDACHIPLPSWCPCPPLITGPDLPLVNHPRSHEAQLGPGLSFVSPPGLSHESFQVFLKQKTKNEPWLV